MDSPRWPERPQWGWIKLVGNSTRKWIKLLRISPLQVDQARENLWINLARNDSAQRIVLPWSVCSTATDLITTLRLAGALRVCSGRNYYSSNQVGSDWSRALEGNGSAREPR